MNETANQDEDTGNNLVESLEQSRESDEERGEEGEEAACFGSVLTPCHLSTIRCKAEEKHTETELDNEELEGVGNLKDEDLDLESQAVLVARGAATARAAAAGNNLGPELALGEGGSGGLEGVGDGVEVGLQLGSGIVLLGEGGVVGVESGGRVCSSWVSTQGVELKMGRERKDILMFAVCWRTTAVSWSS